MYVCLPVCSGVVHRYYSVHMGVKDDFGCQPLLSTLFKMESQCCVCRQTYLQA